MAPMGYSDTSATHSNYNFSNTNADWSWVRRVPRRTRERDACKTCWKVAGWPDRKDLEWFQYRSGRPVHMAEPGDQRLLCGRTR